MSFDSIIAIVAPIWGIAMALSPILQIRRMLKLKSSEDVSVGYFLVLVVGFIIWGAYGWSIDNKVILIPNIVATIAAVMTVVVALRFRRAERSRAH